MHALHSFRLAVLATAMGTGAALAAPPADLDARVEAAMRTYEVPGLSISIVEDGKPVLAKGYGVRKLGTTDKVDADTIFPTGSTGKAITSAALAILVDEGKLRWDDPVIDHMPWFRMYDPWVTREMTVRDLLVHRSGLGLGAGDLMFVPRSARSRADTVRALRYIKPATSFRSGYAYDNVLYAVAGQLIEEVSGQRWEDFVRERVLKPAGMRSSVTEQRVRFANPNRAWPHGRIDGRIRGTGNQQVLDERDTLGDNAAPAGGLSSSANDLSRWVQIQLARGAMPGAGKEGPRLFSEAQSREMWAPQVLMPVSQLPPPLSQTSPMFNTYALGWTVHDYRGARIVDHAGGIFGVVTMVVLIPERNTGFTLQMNSEDTQVLRGLTYELLDHYLDAPKHDWIADFAAFRQSRIQSALTALDGSADKRSGGAAASLPLAGYAGRYSDPWYGPIEITLDKDALDKGALRVNFTQTPRMSGRLEHWQHNTFRAVWDDRNIEPAYLTFAIDADGKVERITAKAVSPIADFSFDYHDLLFSPVRR
jgi:CubicO group peptidase (beta-lactamase class C family)